MSKTLLGHVRVVDYDSPWLPPRRFKTLEEHPDNFVSYLCRADISPHDVPLTEEQQERCRSYITFNCTRAPHSAEEIHVTHFWYGDRDVEPAFAVVWGGE